jgi:predicted DNA-binding transcriptional regulator YafY
MTALNTKAQRVRAVLEILSQAEYSARDLTQRLGFNPNKLRSVQRDLEELCLSNDVERLNNGRYRCPLKSTSLNRVEALAVYSAARMLYHHAAEYNEHYLSALRKLTEQLPAPARRVALLANEAYRKRPNRSGSRTFELVAQAWLDGQVLRTEYHSLQRVSTLELIIYFIELNPRNREGYAIAVNRLKEGATPYVYRLSRMSQATLLPDRCEIPEEFHPFEFLSNAWGIMTGDPVQVELFFSPAVRDRVTESHLGDSAQLMPLASGHTQVKLTVGGWKELVPWILGWGPEVEVISPAELRTHVATLLTSAAALYQTPEAARW